MDKTMVLLSDDDEKFECYTDGGYWNGWASVYFTREQLQAWIDSTPYDARFLGPREGWNKTDSPICVIYFEDEDVIPAIQATDENGRAITVYPMEGIEFMYASDLDESE